MINLPDDLKIKNSKASDHPKIIIALKDWLLDKDLTWILSISNSTVIYILLFISLYVPLFYYVGHYGFWRHDDLIYLPSFEWKFRMEGRWVIYLLFELLKVIPNHLSWYLTFLCFFCFFYVITARIFNSRTDGFLVSCICMASPAYYSQMNWPSSVLPAALLLVACTKLSKNVSYYILLPVVSIIFFGIFPQFIYLLPLFYLDRSFSSKLTAAFWWAKFIAVWGASFVLGYAVANLLTWIKFGNAIQFAAWRRPNPATDIASLVDNLFTNVLRLKTHFSEFFPYEYVIFIVFLFILAWAIFKPSKTQDWPSAFATGVIGIAIAVCHYIITAPAGIIIQHRTVFSLYIGIVFVFLSLCFVANKRTVIIVVLFVIALPAWYSSYRNVLWFSRVTSEMRESVHRSLPRPARAFDGVIVDSREFLAYYKRITKKLPIKYGSFFEGLDSPYRWIRALTEEGFTKIYLCSDRTENQKMDPKCSELFGDHDSNRCYSNLRLICPVGVTENNELILRLQP